MLSFMIIGLPRSGTTWASNFFTTDDSICVHDPLYTRHYRDLDSMDFGGKHVGVACTGLWRFPEFVNGHRAPKIILRRPLTEINGSMADIGLPGMSEDDLAKIATLNGEHFLFSDLFNPFYAKRMCEIVGVHFDADRHAELVQIEMQPKFSGLKVGAEVTRRLVAELQGVLA